MSGKYTACPFWEELGSEFYDIVQPASFPQAILRYRNQDAAQKVGLSDLTPVQWQDHFWKFEPLPQNLKQPLALRYHGHQFMHYNPELGDGRGFLFAQLLDLHSAKKLDLGTKGSGQTPWSRRGDGRLTLKGAVREALATHFLESQGVNTSQTFSIFETGESLERNDEPSPTRSAVLVRLSHGHVRIGTFQRLAYLNKIDDIKKLVQFCIQHYYPHLTSPSLTDFFNAVCKNIAETTAQWMIAGFVHGVLNTDNINISGESFDYGPYRFLPFYDSTFTAAYFDRTGLYAYGQQPRIMLWNLQQLAKCLQLADSSFEPETGYQIFQNTFNQKTLALFFKKLNLKPNAKIENNENFFSLTIRFLEKSKTPYESFFFDWFGGALSESRALSSLRKDFYQGLIFKEWLVELKKIECANQDLLKHEYFKQSSPNSLVIDEIENIWAAIDQKDNWSLFYKKIEDCKTYLALNRA